MNKRQKGSVIELKCIERFIQYGFNVSIPYGDSARYDFIVDFNGTLNLTEVVCGGICHLMNNTYETNLQ